MAQQMAPMSMGGVVRRPQAGHARNLAAIAPAAYRPGEQPPPGLILPNQRPPRPSGPPGSPQQPPRLIVPGGESRSPPQVAIDDDGSINKTPSNRYRPPPGFMDEERLQQAVMKEGKVPGNADAMLQRVRGGVGKWHERAAMLEPLRAAGFDGSALEDAAGVPRKEQSVMRIAGDIRESLMGGAISEEALRAYDVDGAYFMLYELRFLKAEQRARGAQYIADHGLDPRESMELARAIKEHERRNGFEEGFSEAAGDCLAFKYFRNVLESRLADEQQELAQRGIEVAVTDAARERMEDLIDELTENGVARPQTARLAMLRMTEDELRVMPVPVVGTIEQALAKDVSDAPKCNKRGVFGVFTTSGQGTQSWVALPQWKVLVEASRPVAVEIPDCSQMPFLIASTSAKSEEEIRKLKGPGILVADADSALPEDEAYCLVAKDDGCVDVVDSGNMDKAEARTLGTVLFVCRPPRAGPARA
eukprot:evm.model.scf_145EXC.4 EVM.evm.TU.scf_145EXC.4   scf_145EXC:60741-67612(+)